MSVHNTARILAGHQRRLDDGSCGCGDWPKDDHLEPWSLHVAKAIHAEPKHAARPPHENTMAGRK